MYKANEKELLGQIFNAVLPLGDQFGLLNIWFALLHSPQSDYDKEQKMNEDYLPTPTKCRSYKL